MVKSKIVYKLFLLLIVFALLIIIPYTFTMTQEVKNILMLEKSIEEPRVQEYEEIHEELVPRLLESLIPYIFYIVITALLISIFFMRKIIISLRELQRGSQAFKDGRLDTILEITSEDEIGDVTKTFNEMITTLRQKADELEKKDIYLNAMLDPLWVVDEDNRVVDINHAFTRLFGYTREDALGASVYDFFDEKNAPIIRRQISEKRDKGMGSMYEISMFAKNGSQIPVLISGAPIFTGERITGKIGILKDFREQSKLRDDLQQSKDYIEKIINSIQDEILVIDKDFRIVSTNDAVRKKHKRDVTGQFCHIVSHDRDHPCWIDGDDCPVRTVFLTGKDYSAVHRHKDGGVFSFHEVLASPVKDSSGNVVQAIELFRDVTDRIQSEEQISRKNRELLTLNAIAAILSRSLRSEEIFAAVLDKLIEMMHMDGGGIYFIDHEKKEMICKYHRGVSEEYIKFTGRLRLGEDLLGKAAVTGTIICISDLSRDDVTARTIIRHSGFRGYCCLPIKGRERVIGVLCLFSFGPHDFTLEEEEILNAIGEMTGIALENIQLYEKMKTHYEYQRRRRDEEHSQLLSLSTKLGSSIELQNILLHIIELVKNFFRANFVWLLEYDEEKNLLLSATSSGRGKVHEIVYQDGISSIEAYTLEKMSPIEFYDIQAIEKFYLSPEVIDGGYQSVLVAPLIIGKKPLGALALYCLGQRIFKEEEKHFLQIIGNMIAVAVERSALYMEAIKEKGLADAVLQSVADGLITVDTRGSIISINKAFEHITAVSQYEAIGLPLCDVFRYSDRNDDFRMVLGECFENAITGSHMSRESELITAYGAHRTFLISSDPVHDVTGTVTSAVTLLRDITREKEIDRIKTELIRSVSHEFRTPLSAIVGMTEMILEGDLDNAKTKKYLNTVLSEGIRLSNMVSDLLNIARIESGKESLDLHPIDIRPLIHSLNESFASRLREKNADLEFTVAIDTLFLGDEEKIKQLLSNLIYNSLTFSDDGCKIHIRMSKMDNDLEIRVSDTGWGIPEEDLPHLSERFYRGKHGQKVKGTGLGLSLCREIVRMHEGTMNIKSSLGEGTEIIVKIPYRRSSE